MLITKFNSMIRSRVVWWIIGGIVIITFVGWFSPRGGCDVAPQRPETGSLDGSPVSDTDIRMARFNTYLELCLATGRILRLTPEMDKELNEEAWRRIAALRTAGKLGLGASREEVLGAITRNPDFQQEGAFSKALYQQFIRNSLGNLGASAAQFEQYLAESIVLRKLQNLTAAGAWVAPSTMQRLVARYTDKYNIEYVTIGTNDVKEAEVKVTEDDLKAYYTAHTNEFEVPPMVAVRYVTFPIPPRLPESSISLDAVDEYYDTHTEEFTVTDTNETRSVTPIEEVRGSISNKLAWEKATQAVRDMATDMVIGLAPGRDGTGTPFEKVAASMNLQIYTSGLFAADADFPGVTGSVNLVTAAFRLRQTPDEYFSDAVVAGDAVYVLALATNTEPYIPAYEEIRNQVVPSARRKAVADAIQAKAASLHKKFTSGLKNKEGFAKLARQDAMNVSTTGYFSAYTASAAIATPEVLEELSVTNPGELTEVIALDHEYLIAYVVDRRAGTEEDIQAARMQIISGSSRRRGRTLFTEMQNHLLLTGRKSAAPIPTEEDKE